MLLAERHPEAELVPPPNSDLRPEFLQSLVYLANTLMPAFRAWFYPQDFGDPHRSDEIKANARSRIEAALAHVDSLLGDGRRFLIGESFTAADMLFTMLARWARNMPTHAESWPNLKRYLDHMKQRPGLRETHARERLTDWMDG
jgi:glutathione S-transferase